MWDIGCHRATLVLKELCSRIGVNNPNPGVAFRSPLGNVRPAPPATSLPGCEIPAMQHGSPVQPHSLEQMQAVPAVDAGVSGKAKGVLLGAAMG